MILLIHLILDDTKSHSIKSWFRIIITPIAAAKAVSFPNEIIVKHPANRAFRKTVQYLWRIRLCFC